nr:MAG TPA: hypothetical protein [Caudoviricetes sp.]
MELHRTDWRRWATAKRGVDGQRQCRDSQGVSMQCNGVAKRRIAAQRQ